MSSPTPKRTSRARLSEEDEAEILLEKHRICGSKYTHFHIVIFVITFLSYAMMHANRKSFSNVKALISAEWTPSKHNATVKAKTPDSIWNDHSLFRSSDAAETFLGTLDTSFMVAYAVGLYISGVLGDRFNLRYVLCTGMVLTSISILLFAGVSEWLGIYRIYWYVPLWVLNGLFQSAAWPSVVAIMGNWFGKSHRGLIFGVWSATASVGNILGSLIVAQFVDVGYDLAMLVPAAMLFGFAIINFFGLVVSPAEVGLPVPREQTEATDSEERPILHHSSFGAMGGLPDDELPEVGELTGGVVNAEVMDAPHIPHHKPITFLQAVLLPGVLLYSLSYACLKLVNYSFFFWLPYYLNQVFHWSQALSDTLSVWYDFGGIVGGIVGGFISDRLKRAPVMFVMLIAAIPVLFFYRLLPSNQLINALGLGILGFFIGGVSNIMSAAVCADLGRQPKLRGNTAALATVTGILDGTGSAGAAVGQILIPILNQNLGWDSVFYMFIGCTAMTGVCILPIVYHEMRESKLGHWCRHCFGRRHGDGDSHEASRLMDDNSDSGGE